MANKNNSKATYGFRMSRKMRNYMLKHQPEDFKTMKTKTPDEQMALEPQLRNLYRKYDGKNFAKATRVSMPAGTKDYQQPLMLTPRSELPSFKSRVDDAIEGRTSDKGSGKSKDGKSSKDSSSKKGSFSNKKAAKIEEWIVPQYFYKNTNPKEFYKLKSPPTPEQRAKFMQDYGWTPANLSVVMQQQKSVSYQQWNNKKVFEEHHKPAVEKDQFGLVRSKFARDTPLKSIEVIQIQTRRKQNPADAIIAFRHFGAPEEDKDKKDKGKKGKDKKDKGKKDKGKKDIKITLLTTKKGKKRFAVRDMTTNKVLSDHSDYRGATKAAAKFGDFTTSISVKEEMADKFSESQGDGRPT